MNSKLASSVAFTTLLAMGAFLAAADASPPASQPVRPAIADFVSNYCLDCHSSFEPESGFDLETIGSEAMADHLPAWEAVARRLRSRQMPPSDAERPDESDYVETLDQLETSLDQLAAEHPQPGRTETFRRMTRVEYQNSIRDL